MTGAVSGSGAVSVALAATVAVSRSVAVSVSGAVTAAVTGSVSVSVPSPPCHPERSGAQPREVEGSPERGRRPGHPNTLHGRG